MGKRSWVRAMKCQLLVISLFIMLLGVSVGILAIITYSGKHFTVINSASSETNSYYRNFCTIVFYVGICLSIILAMAALVSIVATIKELEGAMAACFFCFAVVFCASGLAAYWTVTKSIVFLLLWCLGSEPCCMRFFRGSCLFMYHCSNDDERTFCEAALAGSILSGEQSLVENAMIDVYDFVYEDVRSNLSSTRRQELYSIHKMFLCCGKKSPFGETSSIEDEMCASETLGIAEEHSKLYNLASFCGELPCMEQGWKAQNMDCLQEIKHFLKKHMDIVSVLMTITIFFMMYGMVLTSFLWYSIHCKNNLDRKGKYVLAKLSETGF